MRWHRRMSEDAGSLPLALLASIVVGGLIVTLVATTMTGQRAARFDREFTTVIQAADAGAQAGVQQLLRDPSTDLEAGVGTQTDPVTSTQDGYEYTWWAEKTDELEWTVLSNAVGPDDVARSVTVRVSDRPFFDVAAFADDGMRLTGGNGASSYGETWFTGNGIVSSNEDIVIQGQSSSVDGVHLYNWDLYPSLDRCKHTGGDQCDDVLTLPDATSPSARIGPPKKVGDDLETAFIEEQLDACGSPLESWTASEDGSTLGVTGTDTVLCYEDMTFDTATTVAGNVELYVSGRISFANDVKVNCADCVEEPVLGSAKPDARALSMYSTGDQVVVGNHTYVGAGIYAPKADCEGNPSNAQGHIYGSMICGKITNQGGWNFYYDDRLQEEGRDRWEVRDWREEPHQEASG